MHKCSQRGVLILLTHQARIKQRCARVRVLSLAPPSPLFFFFHFLLVCTLFIFSAGTAFLDLPS